MMKRPTHWEDIIITNIYESCSVKSNSLQSHGLQPARLLCSWDFPGKKTGVGCHFLLQRIFPMQGLNPHILHCRQICYCLSYQGSLRRVSQGLWKGHVHTAILKMDNQQGPIVQHMKLCSMLCASSDGRGGLGRMDTCICMAESLHSSPETITQC